jgi:hypothetical protein
MPDLAVIVVGMDLWKEYTEPAMRSIQFHMPDARLFIMDCGRYPYPAAPGIVKLAGSPSYAYAMNRGVEAAGRADWYLFLNNDIMVYEPLDTSQLDPAFIYAKRILQDDRLTWIDLWLALIPRPVWQAVGEWDEEYKICGFEDADYCERAIQRGVTIAPLVWDIKHFWGKTRWKLPNYKQVRMDNKERFYKKHGYRLGDNPKAIYG